MKKIIFTTLFFVLCLGLCACGGTEEAVIPTMPEAMAEFTQPVTGDSHAGTDATAQSADSAESTGETFPWESEFREEDYTRVEVKLPKGEKSITWREGSILGRTVREIRYQSDGSVIDSYYYPSGNTSHNYAWWFDGGFTECCYLDNGYFDETIGLEHYGTLLRLKDLKPDGTYHELHCFPDGTSRKTLFFNPNTGERIEDEYFKDQSTKYHSYTSKEYTLEERYNEEGFCTYFYSKDSNAEYEYIADETGKLIKVTENGKVIEDPAILSQYAQSYNFKE